MVINGEPHRQLGMTEEIKAGDIRVHIEGYHEKTPAVNGEVGYDWDYLIRNVTSSYKNYPFYRRIDGPRKLPINPHYSAPLPLP